MNEAASMEICLAPMPLPGFALPAICGMDIARSWNNLAADDIRIQTVYDFVRNGDATFDLGAAYAVSNMNAR